MKKIFLFLFTVSGLWMHGSERIRIATPIAIPSSDGSARTFDSDDDIMCSSILDYIRRHSSDSLSNIEQYVREVVSENRNSPIGRENTHEYLAFIAYSKAMQHTITNLDSMTTKANSRLSKRTTALICTLCTSVCSVLTSILVYYNQKC